VLTLVWGLAAEPPIASVLHELELRHAPTVFLDQHQLLQTRFDLCMDSSGQATGALHLGADAYALEDVTAVYARPYDSRALPAVEAAGYASDAWQHGIALDDALWAWTDVTPALVVNRVGPTSTNGSKPYQLMRIRDVGFEAPETLITTDPDEADTFWAEHRDVVYKSISATRSIVHPLVEAHRARLADIAACPTQFQRRVPGTDYRVHVVGDELFTCRIASRATDYRYPSQHDVDIAAASLPNHVEEWCMRAAHLLELHVAGIDLRRTPDDAWYCFEVNPSPAFTYFEDATSLPIGAAIARLLHFGASAGQRIV